MAEKINMTPKQSGDQLTAAEFNTIVGKIDAAIEEVNGHAASLAEAQQALGGLADDLDSESQARQQADSGKVDKQEGLGLSENSFTTHEKTKLAAIDHQVSHLVTWAGGGEKPVIDADKLIGELVEGKTHLVTTITFTDNSTVAIVKVTGDNVVTFNPPLFNEDDFIDEVIVNDDLSVFLFGYLTTGLLIRLNPDGSEDDIFRNNLPPFFKDIDNYFDACVRKGVDGSLYVFNISDSATIFKLNADGTENTSFRDNLPDFENTVINCSRINTDGTLLMGISGASNQKNIRKLNADGTENTAFLANVPSEISGAGQVNIIAKMYDDGSILIAGTFAGYLKKLNADGTENLAFTANLPTFDNNPISVEVDPDGCIFLWGNFTGYLKKLNADGTEDTVFAANLPGLGNGAITSLVFFDNTILICGDFPGYLKRLNPDGTENTSFTANLPIIDNFIESIYITSTNEILLFISLGGVLRKLNADGTENTTFTSNLSILDGDIQLVKVNSNEIFLAGGFPGRLKKINLDGSEAVYEDYVLMFIRSAINGQPGDLFVISPAGTIARLAAPASPATLRHSGVAGSLPFWDLAQ